MQQCGYGDDHCCYIDGQVCRFLEENTIPERRWVCGLRRELESWAAVYEDPRYLLHLKPFWDRFKPGCNCGDWPPPGRTCCICGSAG